MWNTPSTEQLTRIPKLYSTEHTPLQDKMVYAHFYVYGCDWYICEVSEDHEYLWGFAILNNDYQCAEWGYVSLSELKGIRIGFVEVDYDMFWKARPALEVDIILKAHPHWHKYLAKQAVLEAY